MVFDCRIISAGDLCARQSVAVVKQPTLISLSALLKDISFLGKQNKSDKIIEIRISCNMG
jgi:hypothetical protein